MTILQEAKSYLTTHSENPENGNYEAYTIISDLVTELEKFQWVSVDERLPEAEDCRDFCEVIAIHKASFRRTFHYASVRNNPFDFKCWMPIPQEGEGK